MQSTYLTPQCPSLGLLVVRTYPGCMQVVLKDGRFTDEEERAVNLIDTVFGPSVWDHAVVIFTHCSDPQLLARINALPDHHPLHKLAEKVNWRIWKIENSHSPANQEKDIRSRFDRRSFAQDKVKTAKTRQSVAGDTAASREPSQEGDRMTDTNARRTTWAPGAGDHDNEDDDHDDLGDICENDRRKIHKLMVTAKAASGGKRYENKGFEIVREEKKKVVILFIY
jgi:hypothetical protein